MQPTLSSATFILSKMYSVNKETGNSDLKTIFMPETGFFGGIMNWCPVKGRKKLDQWKYLIARRNVTCLYLYKLFPLIGLPSYFNIINRKSQTHDENLFQFYPCVWHENGELQFRWTIRKLQWNHLLNEQGHENAEVINLVFAQKILRRGLKLGFRTSRSPDDLCSNLSARLGGKWKIIAKDNWQ